ncbi:unnamed protein product [Diabrotica balteata]|uniref:Metalloendopeptidase n=1 Tax=Diabrotica balteata TaxID=107213 RepID=A0A9N9X6T8_DIABA|nr:unnamed protein product [Diabrotica balteata]
MNQATENNIDNNDDSDTSEDVLHSENCSSRSSTSATGNKPQRNESATKTTKTTSKSNDKMSTPTPQKRKISEVASLVTKIKSIKNNLNSTPTGEHSTPHENEHDIFGTFVSSLLKMHYLSTARAIVTRDKINAILSQDIVNKTVKKASANYTNPEENEKFYEGDILIPESSLRNGIVGETFRWDKGIIPYVIAANFTAEQIKIIHRAFATFHEYTCLKFIPRNPNDQYYINITDEFKSYCFSFIGRQLNRIQTVNLGNRCFKKLGTTIHELMHAAGFWHEQSRTDRDKFVNVLRRNIKKGKYPSLISFLPGTS